MEETINWVIDPAASNIRWEGGTAGAMVYSHFGSIALKEGKLTTTGNTITGGGFVVDMNTITPQDNGYNEENTAAKLVGHLATADFFDSANHPTASFTVKSAEGNTITGDLTVRGITNEEKVMVDNITINPDGTMNATGTLVFDRQKYEVRWAHFMKDVILADDINLQITLSGKKG